jgi:hypothetical protein
MTSVWILVRKLQMKKLGDMVGGHRVPSLKRLSRPDAGQCSDFFIDPHERRISVRLEDDLRCTQLETVRQYSSFGASLDLRSKPKFKGLLKDALPHLCGRLWQL